MKLQRKSLLVLFMCFFFHVNNFAAWNKDHSLEYNFEHSLL